MKIHFNIYGLPLEISTDQRLLRDLFEQDLCFFRRKSSSSAPKARIILSTLPVSGNGSGYPMAFLPYQEISQQKFASSETQVTRYGRSSITVIHHLHGKEVEAAVLPDPDLIPDPIFTFCFTQPVSLWLKQRGFFFLHAGCVSKQGEGILIVGPPRSGKSSLSASCLRSGLGFKLLGDDQPLLSLEKGTLWVHPFPRRLRLDRAVASRIPELRPLLAASSAQRLIFRAEKVWPGCIAPSCKPKLLIFPCFRKNGKLQLSPLQPSGALAHLMKNEHFLWYKDKPFNKISHQHLALFEQMARRIPAFKLDYRRQDTLRIPSLLDRLLKK